MTMCLQTLSIQYKTDGKRVETMCDVLDAAIQKGMKQGIEQGIEQGLERGRNVKYTL